jgi:hypothetical protein
MRFLGDCLFTRIPQISAGPTDVARSNVRNVRIQLDDGVEDFSVEPAANRSFDLTQANLNSYELDLHDGRAGVTYFTENADRLLMKDREGVTFLLGAHLTSHNERVFSMRPRTMTIDIDGTRWLVSFSHSGLLRSGDVPRCHNLPFHAQPGASTIAVGTAVHASVLVHISRGPPTDIVYVNTENSFSITGSNGWLEIRDLPAESLQHASRGYLSLLISHGNATNFRSDGNAVEMRPYDASVFIGDLAAEFTNGGNIHVEGIAGAAWRNDERPNRTQWENLPSEWKISLIVATLTSLGFLGRWTWKNLRTLKDKEIAELTEIPEATLFPHSN